MNDNLILILAILAAAGIGAYLGIIFTKLKSKSEKSTLEERQSQMGSTIAELKDHLNKTEAEREDIRGEKEFLNTELTRRNTEYQNLQQHDLKREAEIEESNIPVLGAFVDSFNAYKEAFTNQGDLKVDNREYQIMRKAAGDVAGEILEDTYNITKEKSGDYTLKIKNEINIRFDLSLS